MTNKEVIHALKHLYRNCSWNEITCEEYGCESCEDALNMAIEALQDTRGKANHVVAEIKVDTDEIMERLEQEWYKPNEWIPCSERLPSMEERKEWIKKNLDGIGYLYPCLVTRYSSINPDRPVNNPYVAKHYFDGEDFVNNGEEVCSEYIIAWMPLPEPYKGGDDE